MSAKKKEEVMFVSPPRLLLGLTFLFWGAMHDRALPALLAALLVEGRHWSDLRWSFGEKGFARAWQLSVLILLISAFTHLRAEDARAVDLLGLLSWLPFMMMPLALAQQYCREDGVPVTTFSFIARRKMAADRRAGRPVSDHRLQLGYPYVFLILIGAGIGLGNVLKPGLDELYYAIGVATILGWGLYQMRKAERRSRAWGLAYLASLLVSMVMVWGVVSVYAHFIKRLTQAGDPSASPFETQTSIGQVRKLQLSQTIIWRYHHKGGQVPALLRLSSYNSAEGAMWRVRMRRNVHSEKIAESRELGGDFEKFLKVGEAAFLFHQVDEELDDFGIQGEIIGMVSDQALVPHPLRTKRLEQVPAEILSANSMGAIQLTGPAQGAMRIQLFADEKLAAIEHDPSERDVLCPLKEEIGLDHFLQEQGLAAAQWTPQMKKGRGSELRLPFPDENVSQADFSEVRGQIERAFQADFTYSLFLEGADLRNPMSEFVNETRKGHCEYFAGATTLLLRRMGIPSRYVVGFAIQEEGSGEQEYLIRGKHAHAWCQAYVGGRWVDEAKPGAKKPVWRCRGGTWMDVDLTPPDWSSQGGDKHWYQGLSDWFQKAKADLVLWFSQPAVALGFKVLLTILGASLVCYLVYKMLHTRRRDLRGQAGSWEEKLRKQGHLRDFERWLARRVGARPPSLPMGSWLRQHLPQDGQSLAESYELATFKPNQLSAELLKKEIRIAKNRWQKAKKNP